MKFKTGDQVRMKVMNIYYYGEITIVSESMGYKVLFTDGDGPDYGYYKEEDLELMTEEDTDERQMYD